MDSRTSWLQSQGLVSNRYRIDAVSPHGSDISGQSLQTDDGGVRGRGAVGRRHIDMQQSQAKFGPISGRMTNNAGNPMNFGPDAFNTHHINKGPVRKKWARGTDVKARKTILDKPLNASTSRVKQTSAHAYEGTSPAHWYRGAKMPGQVPG